MLLVADLGRPGFLDPEDEVVSAQKNGGGSAERIERELLGIVAGPRPIHIFQRSPDKGERRVDGRFRKDNPIWGLSPTRQWMALAGMAILVITLLRWGRKRRRQS
jgi:hypothetical protein